MTLQDSPRIPPRTALAIWATLVILLMIVGAVSFVFYARRNAPKPGLIAVAPFDIFAPGLEEWRVRLAEGVTTELASTPPLSAVPQAVVRERWRGSDRPEVAALELARRTSAGVALYGRLDSIGGRDSVRVQVAGIDATSTRVLFGILLRWPVANLPALPAEIAEHVRHNYLAPIRRSP